MSETKDLATLNQNQEVVVHGAFANISAFESAQRMATALSRSDLVPSNYKNNTANCLVALEIAQRGGSSIMAVMQNLHIIHGRPSWSSKYTIAALNACGRFTPLKFEIKKLGKRKISYSYWTGEKPNRVKKDAFVEVEDMSCIAYATDKSTGERVEGPEVTVEMAVKEGWYTKPDSKWQTLTSLMLMYRAGKFFGDLYAPDVTMGMQTEDEIRDVTPVIEGEVVPTTPAGAAAAAEKINAKVKKSAAKKPSEAAPTPEPAPVTAEVIDVTDVADLSEPEAGEGDLF